MAIKFGSEVYTWFMQESGKAYENKLDHMIAVAAKAGFAGIEPIHFWMGDLKDPTRLKDCLSEHKIDLAGIALVLDWNNPEETGDEKKQADEMIALLQQFPQAKLCTVQMPTGRDDLEQRRLNLADCVNAVSRRAKDAGVSASFHPNSPPTSINRTAEDYGVILDRLDPEVTGWTPDVGHIVNGDMDVYETMEKWAHLIDHIHYKDWDGVGEEPWALMGTGKLDFKKITQWLIDHDFDGWIVCEDECERAIGDPDGVTLQNGEWCKEHLFPMVG